MNDKKGLFLKLLIVFLAVILLIGVVAGVKRFFLKPSPQTDRSSPEGPVEISIDFPKKNYQVGEGVLGDKAGSYYIKPLQEELRGVYMVKFSRKDLDRVKYPVKEEYELPITGEKRRYLKEEIRESVSEKEFQKRLQGEVPGVLRAFLLNDSQYRAYKASFPDPGEYIYTVAFYSCADINKEFSGESCFQVSAPDIDKKIEPAAQASQSLIVSD